MGPGVGVKGMGVVLERRVCGTLWLPFPSYCDVVS